MQLEPSARLGRGEDRRRREHPVADAADLDDERIGGDGADDPLDRGDHPTPRGRPGVTLRGAPLVGALARRAPRGRPARSRSRRGVIGATAARSRTPAEAVLATAVRVRHPGRDRERIGRVVGPRQLAHAEHELDHPLDLRLVGRAVARDRALDLARRRLADRRAVLGGRQQHDPARLAHRQARSARCARRTAARRRSGRARAARAARRRACGSPAAARAATGPGSSSGSRGRPRAAARRSVRRSRSQARPSPGRSRGPSPSDLGEDVLGDVEVGGDPLDVVEVLEQPRPAGAPGGPSTNRARPSAWRSSSTRPSRPATPAASSAWRTVSRSPGEV